MKLLIDTADIKTIRKLYDLYQFDGVTTNPKILSKVNGDPIDILKEIRDSIPEQSELHVQVVSDQADSMVEEANYILKELGRETHIKIPVCREGYQAIRRLSSAGVHVTATAIFSQGQALMAAHEGAASVAPYLHRINNRGYDGMKTVLGIQELLAVQNYKTELLAAAFENAGQVAAVLKAGVGSVTVAPEIWMEMLENSLTEDAVKDFYQDFTTHFASKSMIGQHL